LKKYKPITPAMRWRKTIYKPSELVSYNSLFYTKKKNRSGRSKYGFLLVYSKGRKKSNYFVKFDESRVWSTQLALIVQYNFFKTKHFLGLIKYVNGSMSLIKLAHGVVIGSFIKSIMYSIKIYKSVLLGCRIFLNVLKKNNIIFDVTLNNSSYKPKIALASGTYCQVLNINYELNLILLRLPSFEKKYISMGNLCTLGRNSNIFQKYTVQGYAGLNFSKGKKPIVRGVAMNPVDHPHGGRTKTNKPEVSPWGWVTKHSH